MESAINRLGQLKGPDLFREVSAGIGHVLELVDELDAAVRRLLQTTEADRPSILGNRPAKVLQNLAQEEAAKVLILLDTVRCPRARHEERTRTLGYFSQHVAKGIYAEVCNLRAVDFKEVARHVESERRAYYLDGPNDVDFICPNWINWRREAALYVDYVCDEDEEGEGECYWTSPSQEPLVFTPAILKMVRALDATGATTPKGLAVIHEVWRQVVVRPSMDFEELRRLNAHTLEVLKERGLLAPASDALYGRIVHAWPFPLWPLDLRVTPLSREDRKAKKKRLREVQQAWTPER
jgi:hypothetical protein